MFWRSSCVRSDTPANQSFVCRADGFARHPAAWRMRHLPLAKKPRKAGLFCVSAGFKRYAATFGSNAALPRFTVWAGALSQWPAT